MPLAAPGNPARTDNALTQIKFRPAPCAAIGQASPSGEVRTCPESRPAGRDATSLNAMSDGLENVRRNTTITLALLGDVMLGRLVDEEAQARSPQSFWADTLPLLRGADAVIANLECALTRHRSPWSLSPKTFHFRADPTRVELLRTANVRCVSLANNHVLDFGENGLLETLTTLECAGIAYAGAGRDLAEARRPALLDVEGLSIAFLAVTDNQPDFAAGPDRPGTRYLDCDAGDMVPEPSETEIAALRNQGADLIVLSAHLGPNMVLRPSLALRSYATAAVDRGVDLVHGHSAHLFQAAERLSKGLVLHDCGDALDDYAVDPELRNDWSFVFLLDVEAGRPLRLRLVPLKLSFAKVSLARGAEFEAICRRMRQLSSDFGTELTPTAEGLALDLAAVPSP